MTDTDELKPEDLQEYGVTCAAIKAIVRKGRKLAHTPTVEERP